MSLALTRRDVIGGLSVLTLTHPRRVFAEPRRYAFAPVEVARGVWMIEGAREIFSPANGGAIVNVVLLETEAGAVVVDTGSTGAMGAEIRAFADQRLEGVAAVLNTHQHPDHWFGNMAFADRPILALGRARAECAENAQDYAEALYAILGTWMAGTAPTPASETVEEGPLEIGGRRLQLIAADGHTPADLALIDESTGTLIAGDLLFLDRAPSLPDADFPLWLAALERLGALDVSGTIPGHGPYHRTSAARAQTRAYLEATRDRLQLAAGLGLSPIEAMAAGPVPEFATLGANPEEYLRSVARRWTEPETLALPVVGGA